MPESIFTCCGRSLPVERRRRALFSLLCILVALALFGVRPVYATDPFQPSAPYYAAYYHPVYGRPATDDAWLGWQEAGSPPLTWASHYLPDRFADAFDPASELYSVRDPDAFYWQLGGMAAAGIEVAVSDWHGVNHPTDLVFADIVHDYMLRSDNPYPNLRWALHYRAEAQDDPSAAVLISELDYLAETYAGETAYLRIDDRPVLFVDAGPHDDEEFVRRWTQANALSQTRFHLVLRAVDGAREIGLQPDSWHGPAEAVRLASQAADFIAISPGYRHYEDEAPRLTRDVAAFREAAEAMVAGDARWKLVTSWNDWQAGTAVEPGDPIVYHADSGRAVYDVAAPRFQDAYLRVLAETLPPLEAGVGDPPDPPREAAGTIPPRAIEFAAGGDISFSAEADATLRSLGQSEAEFFVALGDLSYSTSGREEEWCAFVTERVGEDFPFQLLVGNHEDQPEDGAFIGKFAECLPNRLQIRGIYAHQYYFDYPADAPLARIILIDPDLYRDGERMTYCRDGEQANCRWLTSQIEDAKAEGLWVIVAVHKTCISIGTKSCEFGVELLDTMIASGVDLVLHGHEHHYARSYQLSQSSVCPSIPLNQFNPACVTDAAADGRFQRGGGTLLVVNGAMGTHLRDVYPDDPERPYFATWMGKNVEPSFGYVRLGVSSCRIQGEFSAAVGGYTDTFSIIAGIDNDDDDESCPEIWTPTTVQGTTSVTGEIRPDAAGKLTVTEPLTVSAAFRSGAVPEPVTVSLTVTPTTAPEEAAARVHSRWELTDLHFALDATPRGGMPLDNFSDAVALQVAYAEDGLPALNVRNLSIALYSHVDSRWILQPTQVDVENGVLAAQVSKPGLYAVIDRRPSSGIWSVYLPYLRAQ